MTLKGGTSQACAACKYQRKRCTPECVLAPHFRPEQTEIFKNAHKLFGVRNILRILEQIDESQRSEAMRSIIYEANIRNQFPVHGCCGVIAHLRDQIRQAEAELYNVLAQVAACKQQRQHGLTFESPESQHLQLGMGMGVLEPVKAEAAVAPLMLFQYQPTNHPSEVFPTIPVSYNGNRNEKWNCYNSTGYTDSKETIDVGNVLWLQQTCNGGNVRDNKALTSLPCHMVNSQPSIVQEEVTHEYDEIYQFYDNADDRQSYIESKDANESSSESSLKDTKPSIEHIAENDLKSAGLQLGIIRAIA